jgi:hypothetical protein
VGRGDFGVNAGEKLPLWHLGEHSPLYLNIIFTSTDIPFPVLFYVFNLN